LAIETQIKQKLGIGGAGEAPADELAERRPA
jgi:recombination protein RecA